MKMVKERERERERDGELIEGNSTYRCIDRSVHFENWSWTGSDTIELCVLLYKSDVTSVYILYILYYIIIIYIYI